MRPCALDDLTRCRDDSWQGVSILRLELRGELHLFAQRLQLDGLCRRSSGNISVRDPDGGLWITPTAINYADLSETQITLVDAAGRVQAGAAPSSELPLHRFIYDLRSDVAAIVHVHPPYATALAIAHRPLQAVHYTIAQLGGRVPLAPYAPYGSQELALKTGTALGAGCAVLMANHGALTVGGTLRQAYGRALLLEELAELQVLATQAGGARPLSQGDIAMIAERIATYGTPPQTASDGPRDPD